MDDGIGCHNNTQYRHPPTDIQHLDVGIGYCRYRVLFRTLTVPDTVIATDTGIRYRYLNGQTLMLMTGELELGRGKMVGGERER